MHTFFFSWTHPAGIRFGTEEWILSQKISETWSSRRPIILFGIILSGLLLLTQPYSFLERYFSLQRNWWPLLLFYLIGRWLLSEVQSLYRITGKMVHFGLIVIVMDLITSIFLLILFFIQPESICQIAIIGMAIILTVTPGILWLNELRYTHSWGGETCLDGSRRIIKYGLPLIPGLGFAYLSNWTPLLILQYFHSTLDVGLFNVGFQVMAALTGLASPISILFLPKLIGQKMSDSKTEMNYLNYVGPTIACRWLFTIMPVIAFVPSFFIFFFGTKFESTIPILLILCAIVPGSVFTALYATLFEIQGRTGRSSFYSAIMLFVSVLFTLALVNDFRGVGLAVGTSASIFVVQILYIIDQHHYLKIQKTKPIILFIFSTIYGIFQCFMGSDLTYRLGLALFGIFCLLVINRRYRMIGRTNCMP